MLYNFLYLFDPLLHFKIFINFIILKVKTTNTTNYMVRPNAEIVPS